VNVVCGAVLTSRTEWGLDRFTFYYEASGNTPIHLLKVTCEGWSEGSHLFDVRPVASEGV